MPPDRSCFTALNLPRTYTRPQCMDYFTLSAAPNTDLWRKPPDRETSTAPILFTSLRRPFVIAEVTVTADWEMEWDQGGLVIFAGPAPGSHSIPINPNTNTTTTTAPTATDIILNDNNNNDNNNNNTNTNNDPPPPYPSFPAGPCSKWVKAGLEFSAGTVNASSVSATPDGADWCLSPLAPPNVPTSITSLRIKLERIGHSLWVWYQIPPSSLSTSHHNAQQQHHASTPGEIRESWRKLREVTWFFWDVEDKSVHVGVYASRPANISTRDTMWAAENGYYSGDTGGGGNGLVVEFEDLEIF